MPLQRRMLLSCLGGYAPDHSEKNCDPTPLVGKGSRHNVEIRLTMKAEARYSYSVVYFPSVVTTMDWPLCWAMKLPIKSHIMGERN